jgi:Carbohydrate binding domain
MKDRNPALVRTRRAWGLLKRRGLVRALLFAASVNLAPTSTAAVVNGGFEGSYRSPDCAGGASITGQIAEGWFDDTCFAGAGTSVAYARDVAAPHGGAAAQKITVRSNFAQLTQQTSFTTGRTYTARLWMRAQAPMKVSLTLRQRLTPYRVYTDAIFTLTTQWKEYAIAGLTDTSDGLIIISALSAGTFWVDDADVTSVATPSPSTAAVPRQFFGMHVHSLDTPWPDVDGLGAIRLYNVDGPSYGTGGSWALINRSPGVFDWAALDAHVNRALAHGADLVMNLSRAPRWASARPNEPSPFGPGQLAEPANIQYWRDWVNAVASRYRGRIRYWEVWNEPPGFFTGSAQQLVTLAQEANAILKRIDVNNKLLGPCSYDFHYLEQYLAAGGGQHTDIVCHHFYPNVRPEVLYLADVPNTRLVMERYGQGAKPLWNTEAGWLKPNESGPKTFSAQTQAALVARGQIINWASRVSRTYSYAWDDRNMNVDFTNTGGALTPAGVAYREVVSWLGGARMTSINYSPDDTWTVQLTRPDGTQSRIVWNATRSVRFAPPPAWRVTQQRAVSGAVSSIAGLASITVGASPLLLY